MFGLASGLLSGNWPAVAQNAATPVAAAVLQPAIWRAHVDVAANLEAREAAALSTARSGIVSAVLFGSGQSVTAGQVLLRLDNGPEAAQLALDQARYAQAERDYARTQKLMSISGSSQSALEQAAAQAAEARAQISLDAANLAQLQIVAPFAGVLGIRNVDPGDYLNAGQAVITLTGPGALRVLFAVPQSEAGGLALGETFTLSAPSSNGTTISGSGMVTALSPSQDTATDARDVEGSVTSGAGLLPGMAAVVNIATGAPLPAYSVPSTALNDSTLGPFLYAIQPTKQGGRLSTVYVKIYGTAGEHTLVAASGLSAGERVVALGGFKLSDGALVTLESP